MVAPEFRTFMIQSATPALAVLPILANQGKGDVEFSTNVVTLSIGFICDCDSDFTDIIRIKGVEFANVFKLG